MRFCQSISFAGIVSSDMLKAGVPFATGQIEMKNMIRIGLAATFLFALTTAAVHLLMAPFV